MTRVGKGAGRARRGALVSLWLFAACHSNNQGLELPADASATSDVDAGMAVAPTGGSGGRAVASSGSGGAPGGGCATDADCSDTASPVCDRVTGDCVECVVEDDCPADTECLEGRCEPVTTCVNSLDCPASQVCDSALGRCADCVMDADCDGDLVCAASHCEARCDSDRDCTPMGKLCDLAAGRCAECFSHAECPTMEHCHQGACRTDLCRAGAQRCGQSEVLECSADGDGWAMLETCGADQTCVSVNDAASCVDWLCEPGQASCVDGAAVTCSSDGLSYASRTECTDTGEVCGGGACMTNACTPAALRCDGLAVKRCDDDGQGETVMATCLATQYCDPAPTPTCRNRVCTPNALGCASNAVTQCNAEGSALLPDTTPCGADVCVGGSCRPVICSPSAVFCSQGDVYTCSADGTQQTLTDTCTAAEYCSPGVSQCQAIACTPGSLACVGAVLKTCNDQGSGYEAGGTDCSLSGKSCIGNACVTCTTSNGGVEVCDGRDNDCDGTPDDGAVCPAGCTGASFGGGAYMFCQSAVNWLAAEAVCRGAGMHLARVDDDPENAWIASTQAAFALDVVWLGGSDRNAEGDWRWIGGDAFWSGDYTGSGTGLYANWAVTTPQPDGGDAQDCVATPYPGGSGWADTACSTALPYVCEDYAAAVGCYDVVQNGSETGVDCGGGCAACGCVAANCPSCGLLESPCCTAANLCGCGLLGLLCQ